MFAINKATVCLDHTPSCFRMKFSDCRDFIWVNYSVWIIAKELAVQHVTKCYTDYICWDNRPRIDHMTDNRWHMLQ